MISGKRIASLLWHAAAARPAAASSVSFGIIARRAPAINGGKNNSARMMLSFFTAPAELEKFFYAY